MAAVTPAAAALPIVFASTAGVPPRNTLGTAGHTYPEALAHGVKYEGDALERLSSALGTHIFPATTESVRLAAATSAPGRTDATGAPTPWIAR